jgi:hypothetical protein
MPNITRYMNNTARYNIYVFLYLDYTISVLLKTTTINYRRMISYVKRREKNRKSPSLGNGRWW